MRLATLLVLIVGTHAVPLSSRSSAMQMAKEVYAVAPHAKHAQPDLLPSLQPHWDPTLCVAAARGRGGEGRWH